MINELLFITSLVTFEWTFLEAIKKDWSSKLMIVISIYLIVSLIIVNVNTTLSYITLILTSVSIINGTFIADETVVLTNVRKTRANDLLPILSLPLILFVASFVETLLILLPLVTLVSMIIVSYTSPFEKYMKNISHPLIASALSILLFASPLLAYNVWNENNFYSKNFEIVNIPFNLSGTNPYEIRNYNGVFIAYVYENPFSYKFYVYYNNKWQEYNDSRIDFLKVKLHHPYTRIAFYGYEISNNTLYKLYRVGDKIIKLQKANLH